MNKTQDLKNKEMFKHFLPYAYFINEEKSVIFNKNDAFQKTFRITYRNLEFESDEVISSFIAKFNNAIKNQLDQRFCIHFETQRKDMLVDEELSSDVPLPTKEIFLSQKERINKEFKCFNTENYITLTYSLKDFFSNLNLFKMLKSFGNKGKEEMTREEMEKELVIFEEKVNSFINQLEPVVLDIEEIKGEELLGFLYSQVTSEFKHNIKTIEYPYIDELLGMNEFENNGKHSKINDKYVACISISEFPEMVSGRILKELEKLNFEFRYNVRFLINQQEGLAKKLKHVREYFEVSKQSPGEYATKSTSRFEDDYSKEQADEVQDAMKEMRKKEVILGQLTATFIITDKSYKRLEKKIKEVIKIINFHGFTCRHDTLNIFNSYFGAMAGNIELNNRKYLTVSTSILCMIPISTPFLGFKYNEHLGKYYKREIPSLIKGINENDDLFHFNLHVSDVGHTMIVGPIGAGKSVLLGLIASQFLKYNDSKVFFFDKDQSSKVLCRCSGGDFYNLGKDEFSFQVMENVDQPEYRNFIREWLLLILEQENYETKLEDRDMITRALDQLGELEKESRTFTNFLGFLAHNELKIVFGDYVSGTYGKYFNRKNTVSKKRFQVYEMGTILKDKKLSPLLLNYLFFDIRHNLDGKPGIIVIDEAWTALQDPLMRKQMEEWLRLLRKFNVSVIFATQSLDEINKTEINKIIIENCKTKILLPNENAEKSYELYEMIGLNSEEIWKIANAVPKREYLYKSDLGSSLLSFNLNKRAISFIGSSTMEDINMIDEIYSKEKDLNKINEMWLNYKKS